MKRCYQKKKIYELELQVWKDPPEYVDEGFPLNEQSNSRRVPVKEEITNISLELLQTVKELRIEM